MAWVSPEGLLKVGPRSAGADPGPLCYGRGGVEVTVTDAHVVLGRIPPQLLGGEIPLDVPTARAGLGSLAATAGAGPRACATGVLEISAWNQANALRQITVKRGLDVRDFTMAAFGGSGPLLLCRLIDILGLRAVLVPRDPGNVSAFGLLSVDVKNDYVRTSVCRHAELDLPAAAGIFDELRAQGARHCAGRVLPSRSTVSCALLTCAISVRPSRCGWMCRTVRWTRPGPRWSPSGSTRRMNRCTATVFAATQSQPVEWVNLRVTAIGPISRPELPELPTGDGRPARAVMGVRPVFFDSWVDAPIYARSELLPGDEISGPAVIEEFGSTIPLHPGFAARIDVLGNVLVHAAWLTRCCWKSLRGRLRR